MNTAEARDLAAGNPLSFLHVTRSEIDLPADVDPYDASVYARAASNLAALTADAPLIEDAEPSLYCYRLRMGAHEQTGLAGCFSVDEYDRDLVKKHEKTRRDKEDDRTRHITELRAQTGLVFLTYKARADVNAIVESSASAIVDDLDLVFGVVRLGACMLVRLGRPEAVDGVIVDGVGEHGGPPHEGLAFVDVRGGDRFE